MECETCRKDLIKHPWESYKCFGKRRFCNMDCFRNSAFNKERYQDKAKHPRWKGGKSKRVECESCGAEFFIRPTEAQRFCKKACFWKWQATQTGALSQKWQGGRRIDKDGYVRLYRPEHPRAGKNRVVLEHVLVAEQALGRYLLKDELVHHINEVKTDNRPENLYLFKKKADHTKYHLLVERNKVVRITKSNLP